MLLTREIELSAAKMSDVSIDRNNKTVTWALPASKTDTRAMGVERTHGCGCGALLNALCPYHNMLFHTEWMKTRLRTEEADDESRFATTPLFPDRNGETVSKADAIDAIRHTAKRCGACLTGKRTGTADALEPADGDTKHKT